MPLRIAARTRRKSDTSKIPDALTVGTAILAGLNERGILDRFEEWFPVSRRGGHGARSLFAFAVTFLLAGRSWGIRPFSLRFATELQRLVAPVAGLIRLPTAAAVSRALGVFTHAAVRTCLDELLASDPDVLAVLASPHVQHRDAHGRGWHVLDIDPTAEAFRQRSLPDDPSLPAPVRIAPGTPGYTGHKRGELRIRHLPIQHAGAGIWLAYRLEATGATILPLLGQEVRVATGVLRRIDDAARVVVRADGEFGSVGAMRTIMEAGADVVTRLCRYTVLDRDEVIARMADVKWFDVEASGGGPPHQAANLGLFTLYPVNDAAEADGGPVDVRVIVTRFPRSSAAERGVLRDGFQLELFATSLAADAWPPEAVAALYFGRAAVENRFAQEDREFGIDRTFSYSPPGQEWMSGIALFLWNVLLGRGVAAHPLPATLADQATRPDDGGQAHPGAAPGGADAVSEHEQTAVTADERADVSGSSASSTSDGDEPQPGVVPTDWTAVGAETPEHAELWGITRDAFADLAGMPGWRLDDERMEIRCPNEKRLFTFSAESHTWTGPKGVHTKHRLWIRAQAGACDGCPVRASCRSSDRPKVPKQLSRAVPADVLVRARELVHTLRKQRKHAQVQSAIDRRRIEQAASAGLEPVPVPRPLVVDLPLGLPGRLVPDAPRFLPATSRAEARKALGGLTLHVLVGRSAAAPGARHPLLARDAADRQRRRRSWRQRAARWAGALATLMVASAGSKAAAMRLICGR